MLEVAMSVRGYRLSDMPREDVNAVLIERYRLRTAAWRAGRDLDPYRRPLPAPAVPVAVLRGSTVRSR